MAQTGILKKYLNVEETAEFLGLSRWTIYRLANEGEIPYIPYGKTGRTKRFDPRKLEEWVAAREVPGKI